MRSMRGKKKVKFWQLALLALAIGTVVGFVWPAGADPLEMDNPTSVNGIETVCTGIGSAQEDPRWKSYPVRVEFSNGGAQYLAGVHVTLRSGAAELASFDCAGSWVLFRLKPGIYKVGATLREQPDAGERSATFSPPVRGQKRVVIQFPLPPNK